MAQSPPLEKIGPYAYGCTTQECWCLDEGTAWIVRCCSRLQLWCVFGSMAWQQSSYSCINICKRSATTDSQSLFLCWEEADFSYSLGLRLFSCRTMVWVVLIVLIKILRAIWHSTSQRNGTGQSFASVWIWLYRMLINFIGCRRVPTAAEYDMLSFRREIALHKCMWKACRRCKMQYHTLNLVFQLIDVSCMKFVLMLPVTGLFKAHSDGVSHPVPKAQSCVCTWEMQCWVASRLLQEISLQVMNSLEFAMKSLEAGSYINNAWDYWTNGLLTLTLILTLTSTLICWPYSPIAR